GSRSDGTFIKNSKNFNLQTVVDNEFVHPISDNLSVYSKEDDYQWKITFVDDK
ncbi:9583_t:CDS:2, partial [Funneliformis caledonium]